MNPVSRVLATSFLFLAVPATWSCGGGLDCPAGTFRQGNDCIPVQDVTEKEGIIVVDDKGPDPGHDPGVEPDEGPVDPGTDLADASLDKGPGDAGGTDLVYPGGFVGKKCQKTKDCAVGDDTITCAGIGGKTFCTIQDCGASLPCPEGSLCMGILPQSSGCAVSCASDADCRVADSFACKFLPDPEGVPTPVCFPVTKAGAPGDPCTGPEDCAGAASCLTNFSGGYCAVLYCDATHPCPGGTDCVRVGGKPVCLKDCSLPADCTVEGESRTCLALKSAITGDKVNVCASGTTGRETGEQCLNDTECKSGLCKVVFTGRCSTGSGGCLADRDCEFGAVCVQKAEYSFGYCTSACQPTNPPCLGQAYCLETQGVQPTLLQGLCMPACGADKPCRAEAGLACIYGDPKYAPGHAACLHLAAGMAGAPCKEAKDCSTGTCFLGTGGGYCNAACGYFSGASCPFPLSCQTWNGNAACYRRCTADVDCPTGFRCASDGGVSQPVCVPR